MIGALLLPVALAALPTAPPAAFPKGVPVEGLLELTREGELVLLPTHNATPFSAFIVTRSRTSCDALESAMLDVERYPERWPSIKKVRVQKRTKDRVEYEFDMDLIFSPTIKGKVERKKRGRIVFHDVDTGGNFTWSLYDVPAGCHIRYRLYQPPGKQSGFVSLVTSIEGDAGDSGEIAGALASARGYTRPEKSHTPPRSLSRSAELAWSQLASHGTVLRLIRRSGKPTVVVTKRRTARDPDSVLWSIRDRRRYVEKLDLVRKVKDRGRAVQWGFGYFGGRVNVETAVTEAGDVNAPSGLRITERVTGGDLSAGEWTWTVRAVEGGTEVELYIDLDLPSGSLILRSLAAKNEMIRDAASLQMALSMMGQLVGGKPLAMPEGPPVAVRP